MNFHSILHRELLLAAKKPTTHYLRMGLAAMAVLAAAMMAQATASGILPVRATGRNLLIFLAVLGLLWALFEGVLLTVDSISREQREGTLGLLFLSNLTGRDIVIGKAGGAGLRTACGLLAAAPAPALTFLVGGVTLWDYALVMAALLNALLFALGLGLFISCLFTNRNATVAAGTALLLWFVIGGPAAGWLLYVRHWELLSYFASISPVTPLALVIRGAPSYAVYVTLVFSNAVAWALLAGAGRRLNQTWRLGLVTRTSESPRVRERTVNQGNPIFAVARTRVARLGGFWVTAGMCGSAAAIAWVLAPKAMQLPIFTALLVVMHFALSFEVTAAASRALAEDFRSGLLELLLTTPLPEIDICTGYLLAIKRRAAVACAFLLCCGISLLALAYVRVSPIDFIFWPSSYFGLISLQGIDLWFNARVGLWKGLQTANSTRAFRRTIGTSMIALAYSTFFGAICLVSVLSWSKIGSQLAGLIAALATFVAIMAGAFTAATTGLQDRIRETASGAE